MMRELLSRTAQADGPSIGFARGLYGQNRTTYHVGEQQSLDLPYFRVLQVSTAERTVGLERVSNREGLEGHQSWLAVGHTYTDALSSIYSRQVRVSMSWCSDRAPVA